MDRNFYFGPDATMVSGSAAFSAKINEDPSAFGLSAAQASAYAAIDAELQSAYQAMTSPATKTPVAVSRKNAAVKAMQRSAKPLSDVIRATDTVSDADLISLGLLPRPQRSRRNAPDAPPTLRIVRVFGRIVDLRVCDKDAPSGRSKPFGAIGAQVFSHVGEQPPADSSAYHYEGMTSRTSMRLTFTNDTPTASTVWLSARWVTARGDTGPASAPIQFILTGGAIVPEAA